METEKQLHKRLVKLLRLYQKAHRFVFFHIKNDVGGRRGNFFYDLKPMGVLPGVADFCLLGKGKVFFLEIKAEKGRLNENQKDFLEQVKTLGHTAEVAYGWDDIVAKVNKIIFEKKS